MTEQEYYRKTDEVLNLFKNGKEKLKTSATFSRVLQMLVREQNPYDIIETLCEMLEDNQKAFEQYVVRNNTPMPSINMNPAKP